MEYSDVLFGVRLSIRYHAKRREFFETLHNLSSFTAVVLGSATAWAFLGDHRLLGMTAAMVVTFFGGLELVLGTIKRSHDHTDLGRKFTELEKRLLEDRSESAVLEVERQRLDIQADEPPVLRVLSVICHNEQLRAQGFDELEDSDEFVPVTWIQRLLSQLVDFRRHAIRKGSPAVS